MTPAQPGPRPGLEMGEVIALVRSTETALRQLRHAQGQRQIDLAAMCGVSNTLLSRIERGKRNPQLVVFVDLCASLDVRPSAVLRMAEDDVFPFGTPAWCSPWKLLGRPLPHRHQPGGANA